MNAETIEVTVKAYLKEMRRRLDEAASIARAAEACGEASNIQKVIEIALDLEQIVYEVNTLLTLDPYKAQQSIHFPKRPN